MLVKRNYKNSAKSIYECDRCKRHFEGSDNIYRTTITNIRSQKAVKSLHLCKHCTKMFLGFVKKGVNNKTNGLSDS